ncbi:MAG: helix-turn-helix domain-containing protein [Streptomycetaceae bacterium]|nr:helix-turn-helix domain-containing protein [Streptomycetaceae bacterium]
MDEGWGRLGRRVAVERGRHYRSRAAFARAAGIGARTLGDVEKGRRSNYSDATLSAIESALGWEPGTCLRIVQGGKVRRDIDPQTIRLLDAWRTLPPEARELLIVLAERANGARD